MTSSGDVRKRGSASVLERDRMRHERPQEDRGQDRQHQLTLQCRVGLDPAAREHRLECDEADDGAGDPLGLASQRPSLVLDLAAHLELGSR